MDKIIITGQHGYVASHIKQWFATKGAFDITMLSLKNDDWKNLSFEGVCCIIHTAALVHHNEKKIPLEQYEAVNTHLTDALAKKAKADGVPHFIFISTMAVYGVAPSLFSKKSIDGSTECHPVTKYGTSKYKAELALHKLQDESFAVTILRPPLLYGNGCPGNYQLLRKLTLTLKLCPKMDNIKSMLYIDNFCELIFLLYRARLSGTFMPQNKAHVKTHALSLQIAKYNNQKIVCTSLLNPFVMLASLVYAPVRKAFGSEYYSLACTQSIPFDYCICDFESSIAATEHTDPLS